MSFTLANLVLDRPLAVLDLESTGVDPAIDRIVEVAVLTLLPREKHELFHRRVKPGIPISPSATAVHGIADAQVGDAPAFATIAPELFATLHGSDLAGFGIVASGIPWIVTPVCRRMSQLECGSRG